MTQWCIRVFLWRQLQIWTTSKIFDPNFSVTKKDEFWDTFFFGRPKSQIVDRDGCFGLCKSANIPFHIAQNGIWGMWKGHIPFHIPQKRDFVHDIIGQIWVRVCNRREMLKLRLFVWRTFGGGDSNCICAGRQSVVRLSLGGASRNTIAAPQSAPYKKS